VLQQDAVHVRVVGERATAVTTSAVVALPGREVCRESMPTRRLRFSFIRT